jgi:hypothetical protein
MRQLRLVSISETRPAETRRLLEPPLLETRPAETRRTSAERGGHAEGRGRGGRGGGGGGGGAWAAEAAERHVARGATHAVAEPTFRAQRRRSATDGARAHGS